MKIAVRTISMMAVSILLLSGPPPAYGGELPDAVSIVNNVNARDEGEYVSRKLTMEMIDKRGKSRVRETFGYRRYYGDEKRSVIFYTSPANIRNTGFLTFDYADPAQDDDQWLYLPAMRKVRRISSSDRGDYFLGTDFTYDDIKKEGKFAVEDFSFETVGEEEIDGHRCFIIEATPVDEKTAKELGYGKVKSWIDSEIWMGRKVEFWDIRQNSLKTLRLTNIEEVDGIWTAMNLEIRNHKTGHTTRFAFEEVDYKAPVNDDVFTERALKRGVTGR